MITIVDAYNCLYAAGKLRGGGGPISLRTLCQWCRHAPGKIILVIDGGRKPHEPHADEFPNLHFVYPGGGAKADPMIARLVLEFRDRHPTRRGLRVVSSDKAVLRQARGEQVIAETAESFLRGLLPRVEAGSVNRKYRSEPSPPVSSVRKDQAAARRGLENTLSPETRYWLERFGFTDFQTSAETPQTPKPGADNSAGFAAPLTTGETVCPPKPKEPPPRSENNAAPQATDLAGLNLDELLGPVKPLKIKKNRTPPLPVRRPRPDRPRP